MSTPPLDVHAIRDVHDLVERIGAASSANGSTSEDAYVLARQLDRFGAEAVAPLARLIDGSTNIWFDAAPPLFWLVERHAAEARGLFLRHLGHPARRALCVRGLLSAGAAADATPLLRDASPAVRLGAAVVLACAHEVDATGPLRDALRDEAAGEAALAMRLALLRRGVREPMSDASFDFAGADTPAHKAWTRVAWLRDGPIREVAASFGAADDARLDGALARRAAGGPAPADALLWRSGAPLSAAARSGLDALLATEVPRGGDRAPVELLLACVRHRLDEASAAGVLALPSKVSPAVWADEAWIDAEGARLEKGGSRAVYNRLHVLDGSDRPEAVQWIAHGLRALSFHGYVYSLWRSAGPLARVEPAQDRLEALPDHGLSPAGERTLVHGAVTATLRLDAGGELLFVLPSGKTKKSLPKPAGAPPQDVAAMEATVKALRRRAAHTFEIASGVLETAMIAGREWSPAAFRARFVDHPFGATIGASLVFLLRGGRSFHLAGGVPRDLESREVALDGQVRIAHPVDLSPDERAAWRARLPSFPPFPQLDRDVHPASLPDVLPGPHPLDTLLGRLAALRYLGERGDVHSGHRRFIGPYFTVTLEHTPVRWNQRTGDVEVLAVRVRHGELDVPAGAIPRALLSEIRADLASLGIEVRPPA